MDYIHWLLCITSLFLWVASPANGLWHTLYQFIKRVLLLMSQIIAQFHSVVLSKILERIVVGRLSDHLERIIFCILLNTVSLNIAPLALIFLRVLMTGVSLSNPRNRLQLFILISLKPLTWFLVRNCLPNYSRMVTVEMFYYG